MIVYVNELGFSLNSSTQDFVFHSKFCVSFTKLPVLTTYYVSKRGIFHKLEKIIELLENADKLEKT
jgi:hypothetical protein